MEIENTEILKGFARSWSVAAKPCDSCKSAAPAVFCRADSAFLCLTCDSKIHCATKLALRHERVWMCEVCVQAPAAVTCKADAAALCVTCDSDIHSANPLASRHERVPVEPFLDSVDSIVNFSSAFNFGRETMATCSSEHTEGASWNITNPNLIGSNKLVDGHDHKSSNGGLFFNEMNSFLEFDYPNPICPNSGSDSVVPVKAKMDPLSSSINNQPHENCFELDFSSSKLSSFNYSTKSIHHSVSSSSLDVGIVPDGNSLSNISHHFCQNVNQTGSDPSVSTAASQASQLYGINREARVLRYREKRKKRKFEKTIRYASRKAYAETRPRIKGRFVKRTETETKVINGIYNSPSTAPFIIDTPYDVVSSFC